MVRDQELQFGNFRLELGRRRLLENGNPVRLGSRALDILIALTSQAGETLSKDDLIARVWPDTTVEEANLRVHVAALRKALGEHRSTQQYIANIPGRGYAFIGLINQQLVPLGAAAKAEEPAASTHLLSMTGSQKLPALRNRIFGRDEVTVTIAEHLSARGFLSLVGPGGMGKTTVAIAVAHRLASHYEHGQYFVDLAPVSDPALVASAVATCIGLSVTAETAVENIISALREQRALILLDNCEHVIEAASAVAEEIFQNAPDVHLLVTSREAMRIDGEYVHRLAPLDLPPRDQTAIARTDVMQFPAVQLFVERATANADDFQVRDDELESIVELCRRLDGMPLAIEFAAARVNQFGIHGLAQRLDDRFQILTKGRRTALPRHQTLRATLDWSYQTLSPDEQLILRDVSIFPGFFTLDAAQAVVGRNDFADDLAEFIASLAMKSLIVVNKSGPETRYRLLETTRAYAHSKLKDGNEIGDVARRHAQYCCSICEKAATEWESRSAGDWLSAYGGLIDDIRSALDWTLSSAEDAQISLTLAASSAPLWYQLSLQDEYRDRAEKVLAGAAKVGADPIRETRLLIALGHSYLNTDAIFSDLQPVFERARILARDHGMLDYERQAIWGLWAGYNVDGEYAKAVDHAEQFGALAEREDDHNALVLRDRMLMRSCHLLGRQADAREYARLVLSDPSTQSAAARNTGYQLDQQTAANAILARTLWLQGYPDEAWALAQNLVEHAKSVAHMYSLCYGIAIGAFPVALLVGDTAKAGDWSKLLRARSVGNAFAYWKRWADCFAAALNDAPTQSPLLSVDGKQHAEILAVANPALLSDADISSLRAGGRSWCYPEILRIAGERLAANRELEEAEVIFDQAASIAQEQGALSWELRIAESLARLRKQQKKAPAGKKLLESVYGRFSEGFDTADMQRAKALLNSL